MKVGDIVKLNEVFYPEYKGSRGVLAEKTAASGLNSDPVGWKVFIQNRPNYYNHYLSNFFFSLAHPGLLYSSLSPNRLSWLKSKSSEISFIGS